MSKSSTARALSPLADELARARAMINDIIIGKPEVVDLAFTALLAGGHLLLEDLPGVGKTTLAQALSLAVGGSWQRIQFTSDMLPADIVGVSVFSRADEQFEFRPGDRKSTRLNSSHVAISYAVFCLKKKTYK